MHDIWKKANVTAIFKKGDRKRSENCRSISLTSVPGKILEKIVRNAIVEPMTSNNLFTNAPHGFIAGKSCVTQLLEFMEDIIEAIDDGKEVDVTYLDFCKAFEKVPNRRLLKMQQYGIKGKVLNWVKEFLTARQQRITVKLSNSNWINITSGILQGSVLGPVLFLIYINDLPGAVTGLMKLFADDAKLYSRVENNQKVLALQNRATGWGLVNVLHYSEMSSLTRRQSWHRIQMWNDNKWGKSCNRTSHLWAGLRSNSG